MTGPQKRGHRNWAALTLAVVAAGLSRPHATSAAPPSGPVPTSPDAARREQAKAEFNQGNTAYNLGKYGEAIAHFEKAYSLSQVPEILFNLGQCYRKRWEDEKKSELGRRALHYYQALVREAPGSKVRADSDQFIGELEPALAQAEARERQGQIDAARGAEALGLAKAFLRDGQLADAAATAERLLREPDNGREILAEAYVVGGRAAARLGDALGAEAQFRRALELRPAAELTDATPPETASFEAARRNMKGGGLRLVQAPLGELPAGKPSALALTVEGDSEQMVSTLELGYRRGDGGAFVTTRVPNAAALAIPAAALTAGARIDYYVRALDAHGGVLAESGTPALPFRLQVAAPAAVAGGGAAAPGATPWYKRWWVWTLVGAVALGGGGAAVYAGTRSSGDGVLVVPGRTND
ncbi:MAG TPA: tetratricopeptide repeat protein [Polyangia bacterium]|nr:tetratricopeptide repeat protein [Polyangia bacterium]